jgi:hypothetical protein
MWGFLALSIALGGWQSPASCGSLDTDDPSTDADVTVHLRRF